MQLAVAYCLVGQVSRAEILLPAPSPGQPIEHGRNAHGSGASVCRLSPYGAPTPGVRDSARRPSGVIRGTASSKMPSSKGPKR